MTMLVILTLCVILVLADEADAAVLVFIAGLLFT